MLSTAGEQFSSFYHFLISVVVLNQIDEYSLLDNICLGNINAAVLLKKLSIHTVYHDAISLMSKIWPIVIDLILSFEAWKV